MHNPVHPGELLQGWLADRGLDIELAASGLGISCDTLSNILHGHAAVSPDIDLLLSDALGTTPCYWVQLQAARDAWEAKTQAPIATGAKFSVMQYVEGKLPVETLFDAQEKEIAKVESAWAKAAYYFRTGNRLAHGDCGYRMRSLVRVKQELEAWKKRFQQGNSLAILQAVAYCADENLPLPTWLAMAYKTSLDGFLLTDGKHYSLDEVFKSSNIPTNTEKRNFTQKQDWKLGSDLLDAAWDVAKADDKVSTMDAVVIQLLALKKWGVKKTKMRELIERADETQAEFLGKRKRLSWFLELRRKL